MVEKIGGKNRGEIDEKVADPLNKLRNSKPHIRIVLHCSICWLGCFISGLRRGKSAAIADGSTLNLPHQS